MANKYSISKLINLDSDKVRPYIDAFNFTVSGSGAEDHDYQIPFDLYLTGVEGILSGQMAGDYMQIKVIDVDNVTGLGANTVIGTPVNKFFVNPTNNTKEKMDMGYPIYVPSGVYIRITYTSGNILASINCRINVLTHRLL